MSSFSLLIDDNSLCHSQQAGYKWNSLSTVIEIRAANDQPPMIRLVPGNGILSSLNKNRKRAPTCIPIAQLYAE